MMRRCDAAAADGWLFGASDFSAQYDARALMPPRQSPPAGTIAIRQASARATTPLY